MKTCYLYFSMALLCLTTACTKDAPEPSKHPQPVWQGSTPDPVYDATSDGDSKNNEKLETARIAPGKTAMLLPGPDPNAGAVCTKGKGDRLYVYMRGGSTLKTEWQKRNAGAMPERRYLKK